MQNPSQILVRQLGQLLLQHKKTLTLAESCTGGACAEAITAIPGSSAWFEVGFVTYSNAAKTRLLQVSPQLIDKHGAVSQQVVEAMVRGALRAGGADVALAVSGIAGPAGGTEDKPVGTVYIAVGDKQRLRSYRYQLVGDRTSVREQSVTQGLKNLLEFCAENLS